MFGRNRGLAERQGPAEKKIPHPKNSQSTLAVEQGLNRSCCGLTKLGMVRAALAEPTLLALVRSIASKCQNQRPRTLPNPRRAAEASFNSQNPFQPTLPNGKGSVKIEGRAQNFPPYCPCRNGKAIAHPFRTARPALLEFSTPLPNGKGYPTGEDTLAEPEKTLAKNFFNHPCRMARAAQQEDSSPKPLECPLPIGTFWLNHVNLRQLSSCRPAQTQS
ncbi:hypothetical protein L3X38_045345 [Prunus dulcis]|uniref:Uncharacterized protein n=1 Tax=Prunus dulcis TaxID=3755 RepID=A0AAD4V0D8_PRUDU|nr:hypothetical protein L3X38_045345 [Prunus dulcis]